MTTKKKRAARHSSIAPRARGGKIITFYSYKGGTGRSLAVANVAWILADSGKKVLVIDWDLEAPGLHRYFHPFLDDKQLADTPGLIDFLVAFVEGSRTEQAARDPRAPAEASDRWFDRYLNYFPYALSLRVRRSGGTGEPIYRFRADGILDFMPAGRQDAGYAVKVTQFDWERFYDQLGGGVFLQCFKRALRAYYDYVLIDSRTGISDASGICTVQMPDDLVVCFTYNGQSIHGAEATARSALSQRIRPSGEPSLRIWPVPTRVDQSEQVRLDAARDLSRQTFQHFLVHLPRSQRQRYWHDIEVPYVPYLAFEELLAPFTERMPTKLSILDSMMALTRAITDGAVTSAPEIPERARREILSQFERSSKAALTAPRDLGDFYLSYAVEDVRQVAPLVADLNGTLGDGSVVWDREILRAGDVWPEVLGTALRRAQTVLIVITTNWLAKDADSYSKREAVHALELEKRVVPVLLGVGFSAFSQLPGELKRISQYQGFLLSADRSKRKWHEEVNVLAMQLQQIRETEAPTTEVDLDDPQKGQWGGKTTANGRRLSAKVHETDDEGWFQIDLEVVAAGKRPLTGTVEFHLHPSFVPARRRVEAEDGRAALSLGAYGAFTVGAEADRGETRLELDLSKLPDAPRAFRVR